MLARCSRAIGREAGTNLLLSLLLCVISLSIYLPLSTATSRYFYHEDDAHHFNRTVEMAQRHDLNPHYFNKPALHFYLRMPLVYASVAYERMRGRQLSTKDIRTRDPYGLAGYSYTPSHPNVLLWARSASVAWSCLLIIISFLALRLLKVPALLSACAALLVLLSPEVLRNSYVVGVDTLMALGCVLTFTYALASLTRYSPRRLTICALLAGLSCAAKYNAAPICIVPLMLWWLCDRSRSGVVLVCCVPVLGFLLGAPFSLLTPGEFWRGVSYEAWHYGVAGHEGHSTSRGIPQVLFYLRWLVTDGLGISACLLALVGLWSLAARNLRAALLLASFPLAYALLMVMQKTHFTRNMLVIVPFGAIAFGLGLHAMTSSLRRPAIWKAGVAIATLAVCLFPIQARARHYLSDTLSRVDSRDQVIHWLSHERPRNSDVAVAGDLQLPISVFSIPGVDAFNPKTRSIATLIQEGYSFFVVPTDLSNLDAELTEIMLSIPGNASPQRIPANPAISILRAKAGAAAFAASRAPASFAFTYDSGALIPTCAKSTGESHCWISSLITTLQLPVVAGTHTLEVMSPWSQQTINITDQSGTLVASTKLNAPGEWEQLPIHARADSPELLLTMTIQHVHSPESQGLSSDPRRLGVAIRAIHRDKLGS
jgi:hypothetical protein